MIKNAGSAVAGDVDVGPAVVVEVESGNAEGVVAGGLIDVRFRGDVFEFSVSQIVIKNVFRPWQAARTAHDRHAFPDAGRAFARGGGGGEIEVHVVGDHQVEMAVAIVIDEGAAGAPGFSGAGDAGLLADIGEGAVAVVVIQNDFCRSR